MRGLDFSKARVLVIGDIMLDRYYYGSVSRISPEAPVPVVTVETDVFTLGGAGNVANNIAGLEAGCVLIGAAGNDISGEKLKNMLSLIGAEHVFFNFGSPTTTKLRIIGSNQQIARLDFEEIKQVPPEKTEDFKKEISLRIEGCGALVLSDYGKGVCTPFVCSHAVSAAKKAGIPAIIDPKGSDWTKYAGATVVTPNLKELSLVCGHSLKNDDYDVVAAGREIRKKYGIEYLVVTRSEKGLTVISDKCYKHMPTQARDVFDVSGAGDTVVAALAAALGTGIGVENAAEIANYAAGIVVGKVGTAPVSVSELRYVMNCASHSKLVPFEKAAIIADNERRKGKRIVFTNGCFDILHKGHVTYLKKIRDEGDVLIVGLNSDDSVKRLKGEERPVNSELDRAEVLAALEVVDYVIIFKEDTPSELIKAVRPDVLAKGGDYRPEEVAGAEYAGKVLISDYVNGYSTTSVLNKARGERQ